MRLDFLRMKFEVAMDSGSENAFTPLNEIGKLRMDLRRSHDHPTADQQIWMCIYFLKREIIRTISNRSPGNQSSDSDQHLDIFAILSQIDFSAKAYFWHVSTRNLFE